jgi:nucleoside-diphosphate-sugar epimerase
MYPVNYGPRNPGPYDWAVVRRVLDGRRKMIIADGGAKLESRVFSENAAAAVLLVVDQPDRAAGKKYTVADRYAYTMRQRIEFIARCLGHELELVDMPYDLAWPCYPYWRRSRDHRLCQSTLIREELGYHELTEPDQGFAQTVSWLAANRPEPGGEAERQVGDPFDYASEDDLMDHWLAAREKFGNVESRLPAAGHQYRHPKTPGEAWRPAAR